MAQDVLARLFDVHDARAVVTGAASGLGFAIAEVLADCGARVTLADIDGERLEEVTRSLAERGSKVRSFVVDVSDETRVRALVDDVVAAEGRLDVVFANAGIAVKPGFLHDDGQRLDTVERSDWDRVLGVNLNGVLFTMKWAAANEAPAIGTDRGHVLDRGPAGGGDGLLRLYREQGRGDQHRPSGGPGAGPPRSPRPPRASSPARPSSSTEAR